MFFFKNFDRSFLFIFKRPKFKCIKHSSLEYFALNNQKVNLHKTTRDLVRCKNVT